MKIIDRPKFKRIISEDYNLWFNKINGFTMRCGSTLEEDPQYSPYGPEIIDMEISSASDEDCQSDSPFLILSQLGCDGPGCKQFCYKKNRPQRSVHMSLDKFKDIMDRMPKTVCSIAFGVISPIERHPQVWEIFEECRRRDVVPNVTINQKLNDGVAEKLARYCGAVAVSVNPHNKEMAYDTINKLSNEFGMNQINIHIVLSNDSVEFVKQVIDDMKADARLANMNALVMLSFKDKAQTCAMQPISSSYYREVIDYCLAKCIRFGFDSCSAKCFEQAICDHPQRDKLMDCVEPCESMMFSAYIDVNGRLYACSFLEHAGDWQEGIDIVLHADFLDIWNSPKVQAWREKLIANGRACPEYKIGG